MADDVIVRGNWLCLRQLGTGGQGTTYLAARNTWVQQLWKGPQDATRIALADEIPLLKRDFALAALAGRSGQGSQAVTGALKVIHNIQDQRARERMKDEIAGMQKARHPALLSLLEANPSEGWYVGEFFPAGTLADSMQRFAGKPAESLNAFRDLVAGVAFLHEQRLVHRDIKPANIFLAKDGRLVLGDFGLVFFQDPAHTRVSATLENVGSRDWMPGWVQAIRVEDIPAAFDVYSLGKVLWSMVSGRPILQREWWDRAPNNLRSIVPNDWRIPWIETILRQTVKENQEDILEDAGELLALIDDALRSVAKGGEPLDSPGTCSKCGGGRLLRKRTEKIRVEQKKANITGNPPMTVELKICETCGNVQWFTNPKDIPQDC